MPFSAPPPRMMAPLAFACTAYCNTTIVIGSKDIFFSKFDCSFGSLNIPKNSPNLEYTSHPAKITILHCHWAWSWPAGSVAPPNVLPCLPHVRRQMKFGTQIHHEQTYEKVWGAHTLSSTGSQPFWCVTAFLSNSCLLWKLSCPRAYTPQSSHSLSIIFMPWKTKVMEIIQLCHTWWAWQRTPFFPFAVKHQDLITSTYHAPSPQNSSWM